MKARISTKLIRVFNDEVLVIPILENIEVYYTPDYKYKVIVSQNKPDKKMVTISRQPHCCRLPPLEKCYEFLDALGLSTADPFPEDVTAEIERLPFNQNIRRFCVP